MFNKVSPRVIFYDNQFYDSTISWEKFNNHEHIRAAAGDFRNYKIDIGDRVYIYNENSEDIFAGVDAPKIDYITGNQIRLDLTPTIDLVNTSIYVKYPKGDIDAVIIYGVNITNGSQLINIATPIQAEDYQLQEGTGLPGMISQKQLAYLSNFTLSFTVSSSILPPSKELVCFTDITYPCRLNKVTTYGSSVSYTAKVYNPASGMTFSSVDTWADYGSLVSSSSFEYVLKQETSMPAVFPSTKGDIYIKEGGALALKFGTLAQANVTLHLAKLCQ